MEVEILLAFLLKKPREFILTHPETIMSAAINKKLRTAEKKRLKNWPLAYLTGHKEFYGLDFMVSPAVLTPRPETEMMVEEIIKEANSYSRPLIIDLGTGSGAIIISLAKEIKRLFPDQFKKIEFKAVDISLAALQIAQKNARDHKLAKIIKFSLGDLLTPIILQLKKRELIIAANLPYLTSDQIKKSPSISREPRLALDGGTEGLKYYKKLFKQLSQSSCATATILCEIGPGQDLKIIPLVKKYWPDVQRETLKDLAGKKRLIVIKIKNG